MTNILRSLSFNISQLVYPLIRTLYEMFHDIASTEFFTVKEIKQLSGNIYIVISVCMLFALGLKLISAIVNPDVFTDEKKGVKSVAMHSIFAVFLIIILPFVFSLLYEFQADIINNQLVEKIVLGADVSDNSKPGQIVAAYSFVSFCEPKSSVSSQALSSDGEDLYNRAVTEDIDLIKDMDNVINTKSNGEYDIDYHAILSPAAGIFICYEMILLCIDIALRAIKLGLLQLMTPLILCGYVVKGTEVMQKWVKELLTTYVLVFVKVATISFMVYGLSVLPGFLDRLPIGDRGFWYKGFVRVFVIIGLLQMVKQLPEVINTIFGTNIKDKGGIRGRLGEMAGIGEIAQRGWDQLRQHPTRLVTTPLSAAGGFVAHNVAAAQRGRNLARDGHYLRAIGAGLGGFGTSFGAALRAGRSGWQDHNLRGMGAQSARYRETHPANSTLGGRIGDTIASGLGFRTAVERMDRNDNELDFNGIHMTVEQLQENRQQSEAINQRRNAIRDAAVDAITADDSNLRMTVAGLGQGNYQQLTHALETMRNAAPTRGVDANGNFTESEASFNARAQAHAQRITDIENALTTARNNTRDALIDYAMQHDGHFNDNAALIQAAHNRGVDVQAIDVNANIVSGRDRGIIETNFNTLNGMNIADLGVHIDPNDPDSDLIENIASFDDLDRINTYAQDMLNDIDTALQVHQQEVYDRHNSDLHRRRDANRNAVNAQRNNNNSGNGGH